MKVSGVWLQALALTTPDRQEILGAYTVPDQASGLRTSRQHLAPASLLAGSALTPDTRLLNLSYQFIPIHSGVAGLPLWMEEPVGSTDAEVTWPRGGSHPGPMTVKPSTGPHSKEMGVSYKAGQACLQ